MNRRQFIRYMLYSSAALGATGLGTTFPIRALADYSVTDLPKTLVNIMLYGGADLRYLFAPAPGSAYADAFWNARIGIYNSQGQNYGSYSDAFANEYLLATDSGTGLQFGIHNKCPWLKEQFDAGNVAVIANAFCSTIRPHDQSQLNINIGEPEFGQLLYERDGWGGRLAEILENTPNSIELSHEISVFCNGTNSSDRLQQVIHAKDTRDIALPNTNPNSSPTGSYNVLTRSLSTYYQARSVETKTEKPCNWPYHLFFQHNEALRAFGYVVSARLEQCPASTRLADLNLHDNQFRQQCMNLYDCCLVPDVLNMRIVSMRYEHWDTHGNQKAAIEDNLQDLFGAADSGALATLKEELALLPYQASPAQDNLVCCFTTDFGRQLAANGDNGTDHGRGGYSIQIGKDVTGGVNGEMFPQR